MRRSLGLGYVHTQEFAGQRPPVQYSIEICVRLARFALAAPLLGLLSGCNVVLLHPSGDVAVQQRDLIIASTVLMLLIIIPVMAMTALFAWRYRHSNKDAVYDPDWHHSTGLEVAIWSAPLAIIVALGALTWISTHVLDPYRPIARFGPHQAVPADAKTLEVDVVALDWKWLFIYPSLGVATVNELAAPVNTPIAFKITSSTMMNSFFIPAIAGQIYAMPGMQTQLHAVINTPGQFTGFSSNYSGQGFSDMHFKVYGMTGSDFAHWVQAVKAGGGALTRPAYTVLAEPSEAEPARRFGAVDPTLFGAIVNQCVTPGQLCVSQMMRMDARDGGQPQASAKSPLAPILSPRMVPPSSSAVPSPKKGD
jgi:cytochrome o ubiquinol oxidase subunit 2